MGNAGCRRTVHSEPPLKVYRPQKLVKNWLGVRPHGLSEADLKFVEERMRTAFPELKRIDLPKAGATDVEDYHATMVWGIDEKKLEDAVQCFDEQRLTEKDLTVARHPHTGQPLVWFINNKKGTVFAIVDLIPSPALEVARRVLMAYQAAGVDWKPKPMHVTTHYGILAEKPTAAAATAADAKH